MANKKQPNIAVDHIDIMGRVRAFGIDEKAPVFHYTVKSCMKGKSISAHQVIVGRGKAVFWDSGKLLAGELPYVTYNGAPLEPKTAYSVRIKIWDEEDLPSKPSEPVFFETGLMESGFIAQWIEPVQEDAIPEKDIPHFMVFKDSPDHFGGQERLRPAQDIRKSFRLEKPVKRARVYASAHGIYELYINGNKAGDAYLAPEISTYQKYLYYQIYDVTKMLQSGDNALAATVADGWWIGRIGLIGGSCQYGNRLGFIAQMEIEYDDGETVVICSDESFRCHESAVQYADLYIGEKRDNTLELPGWRQTHFDDSDWAHCDQVVALKDNLVVQPTDSVGIYQYLMPLDWLESPKNECIVDFGQVIAGTVELTVDGREGQEITLDYCEVLDENGNYLRNIMGRNKDQRDVLICRDGLQTWQPTFTYHGFRYVRITGAERGQLEDLRAAILTTALRETGQFECSDERLSQLQKNILWSERGNMLSIPTDCPQREKMGWTGDIQIFAKTGAFNYDLKNFLEAWLTNLRAEQKEDGAVPVIVPNFPKQELMQKQISGSDITSSGWSDACVLLPWYLYECYGNVEVLKDNFHCMRRYLNYVKEQAALEPPGFADMDEAQRARSSFLWNKGYHYGDWLIPSLHRLPDGISEGRSATRDIVGSCWYAITVKTYLKILRALKKSAGWSLQNEIYEADRLLKSIRQAIREEYVSEDGSVGKAPLQGLYVMILRSGAVEGALKKRVAEKLVSQIRENSGCLDTGFSSVGFLLDVLTENGYKDIAYSLLFQDKAPSWLYMVDHGATTIWEFWEAITPDGKVSNSSYNHYAYGCVGDWIYRNIGGIAPGQPGYKQIIFAPDLDCGLSSAACKLYTPLGAAMCDWQLVDGECQINLEVPVGATAELHIRGAVLKLDSGRHYYIFNIQPPDTCDAARPLMTSPYK